MRVRPARNRYAYADRDNDQQRNREPDQQLPHAGILT